MFDFFGVGGYSYSIAEPELLQWEILVLVIPQGQQTGIGLLLTLWIDAIAGYKITR